MRHVVCISNNLEQTSLLQQKWFSYPLQALRLTVFLSLCYHDNEKLTNLFVNSQPKKYLTALSTNKTFISLLHISQWYGGKITLILLSWVNQ